MLKLAAVLALVCLCVSPALADDVGPKKVALLVGVEEYLKPGFDDLEYCEDDVTAVGQELKQLGFEVTVLLGSAKVAADKATKANIEATANRLVMPLGKKDLMLIMFSGHGQTLNPNPDAAPNELKIEEFQSYFCPYDAQLNEPSSQVALNYLLDDILAQNVGRKLLVLDACRDIPVDRSKGARNARGIDAARIDLRAGTSVYLSCSFGQRSFEKPEVGHGLFTYCLLEGLRGGAVRDGELTWADLVAHVNRKMRSPDVLKLMPSSEQQVPFPAGDLTDTVLGRLNVPQQPAPAPPVPKTVPAPSKFDHSPLAAELRILEQDYLRRGSTVEYLQRHAGDRSAAWKDAAKSGDAIGEYLYARLIQTGTGVQSDQEIAFRWMKQAAEQGLLIAQTNMGVSYLNGDGVSADEVQAVAWFQGAADANYPAALVALGECYHFAQGVSRDEEEAASLYRRAADLGAARGMYRLAGCLQSGTGCPRDAEGAYDWYLKAAELGYAAAYNEVGLCLENGRGSAVDVAAANRYYRLGAEGGDEWAQNNIGWNLLMGIGVTKNQTEAVAWFRKSAVQGNMRAQTSLGWCLQNGFGVQRDDAAAVPWLRKAADQGFARAQGLLGNCYERGRGIAASQSEAIRWYRLAAAQGDQEAQQALDRLGVQ